MTLLIDYFLAPQSPWAYLGHRRLIDLAGRLGVPLRLRPMDLGGKVFPISGGLPVAQRAPQRQAYRLLELRRHAGWLGLPLNPQPRFFPVHGDDAARLIIAVTERDGLDAGLRIAEALMRACWVEEAHIADEATLAAVLQASGLPAQRLADSHGQAVDELYEANTRDAIALGVFGAPSYVVRARLPDGQPDDELFWGQDRLDFLERSLRQRLG